MDRELKHIGTKRHSGRYPWGSGKDAYERGADFAGNVKLQKKQGLSSLEIARNEGISTGELRKRLSLARIEKNEADRSQALKLKEKGYSTSEIGRRMGRNESSIRSLLNPVIAEKAAITKAVTDTLRENVDKLRFVDVGSGVEVNMGITRTKLNTAVGLLEKEGYKVHSLNVDQVGNPGKFTIYKVLGTPDSEWKEIKQDPGKIQNIHSKTQDYGRTFSSDLGLKPIQFVDSKRIEVRYSEDGGRLKDGVIELRKGVPDLDIGRSNYAQVRIGVDGTHYLKGMAIYSDKMPDGVDIVFNTNKTKDVPKMKVFKTLKDEPDNPFGSTIKDQRGALNIVNEEGDWDHWSRTISSQILSKQPVSLAKKQLDLAYKEKKDEYDEIMSLTNPIVKKKLLMSFADDCDSSSVHLKAAALPRQASKVILPIPDIKPTEVYAPTFNDGEVVVLIRHPHAGVFEIPQLTVNNKSKSAKSIMGNAKDAIGIHPKVAQKLSGADFDGDAVIVIPNKHGLVQTSKSLTELENFDPILAYPPYHGMKTIDGGTYNAQTGKVDFSSGQKAKTRPKQTKMGEVSNLITDMTIKGAGLDEIARAVKHSMVVIDSEKHHLNYVQSYKDNGIASLSASYQNGPRGGASTLISKASSKKLVPERKPRSMWEGGPIDKDTGEKVYTNTGRTFVSGKFEIVDGKRVYIGPTKVTQKMTKTTKMAEEKDAFNLSSGRPIEEVYASYANSLKALGNASRKEAVSIRYAPRSPSATKTYEHEVATLQASLNLALKNKPLEREAQKAATSVINRKKLANPNMEEDDLKKLRNQALAEQRVRTGASKYDIKINDREWEAIQAGAISASKLEQILENSDLDQVKRLATPHATTTMTASKINRAQTLLRSGATQAQVAEALGVSIKTLNDSLK